MSSNIITQTSLWGKQLGFRSILPISLQQIKYEKIHGVHSNELAYGYTLIQVSFYIDQYRGKHFKTPRFFTNFPDFAHLWNLNTDISLKLDKNKKMILYNYKGSRDPSISRHLKLHSTVVDTKQWKKPKIWRFYQFWKSKNRRWKKRRFYGYSLIHIWVFDKFIFFQIARKCDISWQDLNLDLNLLNVKTPTY